MHKIKEFTKPKRVNIKLSFFILKISNIEDGLLSQSHSTIGIQ